MKTFLLLLALATLLSSCASYQKTVNSRKVALGLSKDSLDLGYTVTYH